MRSSARFIVMGFIGVIVGAPAAALARSACPSGGTPAPGSRIKGGLTVDGTCVLSGVTVDGGVTVLANDFLIMSGSTVNGGIDVKPGGELDLGFNPLVGQVTAASAIHGVITDPRTLPEVEPTATVAIR